MDDTVRIVGMGGSLAARSTSLAALEIALDGAASSGAQTELFDLAALDLPVYAPDREPSAEVLRFCDAVYAADGLLWSSPLYHGTISGVFKNALDWLQVLGDRRPAYLTDKVIGLISTAGGTQGLQAINTMEFVVRALRGWSVPLVVPVSQAWRVFDEEGRASDAAVVDQLRALGREVARASRRMRAPSRGEMVEAPAAG